LCLKATNQWEGCFDLPGGRIDTDEYDIGFDKIIAREAREEIGDVRFKLNLKPVALGRHSVPAERAFSGKAFRVLYIFFEAEYLDGEIKTSHEHGGYEWLNLKNINPVPRFISGVADGVEAYVGNNN